MADGPKNSGMYTNVKKTLNCRLFHRLQCEAERSVHRETYI